MADGTPALYYGDARAEPQQVSLCIRDQVVFVDGAGVRRSTPLATVQVDGPFRSPHIVRFSDGAYCVAVDPAAVAPMLGGFDRRPSQWEAFPRALTATVALLILAAVAAYIYAVPFAARLAADQVPISLTAGISRQTLSTLDETALSPSKLPPARQAGITDAFTRISRDSATVPYTILFRSSGSMGPTAFALPSGTIVMTDELVALARDERELLGVLAHEAGHIERRHTVRLVLQGSVVALFMAWSVGDFTSLLALAPAALLQANYSRGFEREADAYAADMLRAHGMSPAALADILERIERQGRETQASSEPPSASFLDYASTHPATSERLEYLRSR